MKQKQGMKSSKKAIIIVLTFAAVALLFGGVLWFLGNGEKSEEIPVLSQEEGLPDYKELEEIVSEIQESPEQEEAQEEPKEPGKEILEPVSKEILSQEPVNVKDITVLPNEEAGVFICYDKDAVAYNWEYYSIIDRKWSDISQKGFESYMESDCLNRYVSCLLVPADAENDLINVRCIVEMPEGKEDIVTEGILHLFEEEIEDVMISELEAEAGVYLANRDIKAVVKTKSGETEIDGLQGISFCVLQNEETTYNSADSLTTETYTKVYKEVPYYLVSGGEQKVMVKVHTPEPHDVEVKINGIDTLPPIINKIRAENKIFSKEVESANVKVYATVTDNYSIPSEIKYAFGIDETEKMEWFDKLPIVTEIKKNGTYVLFAKDAAGNIAKEQIEIITVDMKAPKIIEVKKTEGNKSCSIEIIAEDKTEMEYCFRLQGEEKEIWQKESILEVSANGMYEVMVRDAAGNISEDSIEISNIDNVAPVITGIFTADSEDTFNVEILPGETEETSEIETPKRGMSVQENTPNKAVSWDITPATTITRPTTSGGTGIQGARGAKGEKGETGAEGVSNYVHFRYAQDARGTSMTAVPSIDTKYIGVYSGTSRTAPSTASSYQWSLYQGEKTNVFIKYAETNKGDKMTDSPTTDSLYIGFCNTTDTEAPKDPMRYEWSKYKQETVNVFVRYSAYVNGDSMTDTPSEASKFMGICTTTEDSPPTDPNVYTWSQYKGSSSYLHIKYSPDGIKMTDAPAADSKYIGVCSTNDPTAPTDASTYNWMQTGQDGRNSYVHVRYAEENGVNMTEVPNENCSHMGICVSNDPVAPTEPSSYSWCKISFGREIVEMKQNMEVMQAQMESMRSEIEELKNR